MYGCEYRLLKKKYGNNHYSHIHYPERIAEDVQAICSYQFERRIFFPKNSALTNVETHSWSKYDSKYEGTTISEQERCSILKASYTGWEHRYGFYLDNGWIYVYRSGFLEVRFRIEAMEDQYRIVNTQCADGQHQFADSSFMEALYGMRIFIE